MPRPPLKFEPGENPPPEDLDENLHSSPGEDYTEGVEDEFDELQSEDSSEGGEESEVEGRPSARETGQEPRRGDRSQRVRELREQVRQQEERAAAAEREAANLRIHQEAAARQQQDQQRRYEEEQLQNLPLEDQVRIQLQRDKEENRRQIQYMQFQNAVSADKADFASKCAASPARRRLADAVEQTYWEQINKYNRYIPRDEIYKWVRGQELDRQEAMQQTRKRTSSPAAQRERVLAPNPRSNSQDTRSRGGGRANETLEQRARRLENYRF